MADVTTAAFSYSSTQDPVIKKFVDEVSDQMKVEIIQSISAKQDPATFKLAPARIRVDDAEEDSVGMVVKEMYESKPKPRQQEIVAAMRQPHVFTPKLKTDISTHRINLRSEKYALAQVNAATRFNFANEEYLRTLRNRVMALLNQSQSNSSPAAGPANRNLQFKLHQVKCLDETGEGSYFRIPVERMKSDQIDLGGTTIDDKGQTTRIDPFRVDSAFDDGDVKVYSPAKVLRTFALDTAYPKNFCVFLALAEKDSDGGFFTYIDKLFKAVKNEVTDILKKIAEKIGRALVAIFGGPIGEILFSLASLILGKLIDWIIGWFKDYDDVFEAQMAVVSLKKASATFNGNLSTSERSLIYRGHGGTYLVRYSWELTR
ncbi:MAG TPA: hypothetical protein VD993_17345 [Chitinophagaceae bacterium]|nr:hypothetical protein [Chitinophagaceae bacterium]